MNDLERYVISVMTDPKLSPNEKSQIWDRAEYLYNHEDYDVAMSFKFAIDHVYDQKQQNCRHYSSGYLGNMIYCHDCDKLLGKSYPQLKCGKCENCIEGFDYCSEEFVIYDAEVLGVE